jgi:hypothetical protein
MYSSISALRLLPDSDGFLSAFFQRDRKGITPPEKGMQVFFIGIYPIRTSMSMGLSVPCTYYYYQAAGELARGEEYLL